VVVGRGLGALSRAAGRGSGSVIGGHAILAIHPAALRVLAEGRQVVLVSGTNGKTTTTKLLAAALASPAATEPRPVLANKAQPSGRQLTHEGLSSRQVALASKRSVTGRRSASGGRPSRWAGSGGSVASSAVPAEHR
jgi:hypothetical protein